VPACLVPAHINRLQDRLTPAVISNSPHACACNAVGRVLFNPWGSQSPEAARLNSQSMNKAMGERERQAQIHKAEQVMRENDFLKPQKR
jgi:hypothetical protein